MPTEMELSAYYNSAYTVPQARYAERIENEFPLLQRLLTRAGARPGRMLEVGCSYGNMLARFANAGWDVDGVELDERAAAYARNVLGIEVHQGSLEQASGSLRPPYDVIAMLHVIEHVRSVGKIADLLASLVAPGGLLLIKTPNAASLVSRILRGWWEWSAVPEHVHLFTPASLQAFLAPAGFTPEISLTRRGDAHGTLHELLRGGVRRLSRARPRGERLFEAGKRNDIVPPPVSSSATYGAVARLLDATSGPFDWLLDMASRVTHASLQPELVLLSRRSAARN